MSDKRKTLTILLIVVATIIGGSLGTGLVKRFFPSNVSFDLQLMEMSSEVNKTCPFMLDKETRLDNTFGGPGNQLRYNFTLVNIKAEEIDTTEFEKRMLPQLINTYKTSPDMEHFRENEVTLIYNYNDKDGKFVSQISISPSDFAD